MAWGGYRIRHVKAYDERPAAITARRRRKYLIATTQRRGRWPRNAPPYVPLMHGEHGHLAALRRGERWLTYSLCAITLALTTHIWRQTAAYAARAAGGALAQRSAPPALLSFINLINQCAATLPIAISISTTWALNGARTRVAHQDMAARL